MYKFLPGRASYIQDTLSYFRWLLDSRCQNPIFNVYNATQCDEAYKILPECLDAIQYALDFTSAETRVEALQTCSKLAPEVSTHRSLENVKLEVRLSLYVLKSNTDHDLVV